MKYVLILIAIPILALAQDFEFVQEFDAIPIEVYGWQVEIPWVGGYTRSCPDYCDIDNDEDQDFFTGDYYGRIALYRNIGSYIQADFTLEDEFFGEIDVSDLMGYSKPVYWDMDADGDFDLFVGTGRSLVRVYRNIGTPFIPQFEVWEDTLKNFNGNWFYCDRPQLVDIDADGDDDLFCGRYTGTIDFYRNIGDSLNYSFQLVEIGVQGIDVGSSSSPEMVDIDTDGDYDLFVGNSAGKIWYYQNDGTPQQYNFADPIENWLGIDVGDYASPEFCDLNGDGDYDLFIGKDNDGDYDVPGAIHYWQNTGTPQTANFVEITQSYLTFDIGLTMDPTLNDFDGDNDIDFMFLSNYYLGWMENAGTIQDPSFSLQTYDLLGLMPPGGMTAGDLNDDDKPDLLTSAGWSGVFYIWVNISSPGQLEFSLWTQFSYGDILYDQTLGDVDGDGDLDLVSGAFDSPGGEELLLFYENQGTPRNPDFVLITENFQGLSFPGPRNPLLVDFDRDGDLDFLVYISNLCHYYENVGTPDSMQLQLVTTNLLQDSLVYYNSLSCVDIDDDNDTDVFIGQYDGGCLFFRNVTGQNEVGPRRPIGPPLPQLDFSIGPNTANPVTWISYSLPAPQEATLAVYNILGAKVTTLASGLHMPGTHNLIWNASQYSSGVYIIRLETGEWAEVGKVVVVK